MQRDKLVGSLGMVVPEAMQAREKYDRSQLGLRTFYDPPDADLE
jgi:hypothetical protein